ncbi:MAG: TldD/PmbA family protein [Clostridiales bacterium]|jgi:PmbA protein|nr:TldD/PmbA family protein [Clostridiales bacterium]
MSKFENFKTELFSAAKKKGFSDWEVYIKQIKSSAVVLANDEVIECSIAETADALFRGTFNGKMGCASSQEITADSVPFLVESASQNAGIVEDKDITPIFAGSESYPSVKTYDESIDDYSQKKQLEIANALNRSAKKYDKKIQAIDRCCIATETGEVYIANSLGLALSKKSCEALAYVEPRAADESSTKNGYNNVWYGITLEKFEAEKFGEEAAERAISYLGAKSVKSGRYKVVLDETVAGDFLSTFFSVFSAKNAQKGFSLLAGKLGETVASSIVTLRDDALLDYRSGSTPFDGEGVACKNKTIIENGVFKTFMHSLKTAANDGVAPTGNGFRDANGQIFIAPTNFYIAEGTKTLPELFESAKDGLYITSVQGLHSGANPTSGDFSLSASGFLIENGKKTTPVEQITVAGNFFDLLKNIIEVGVCTLTKEGISSPPLFISEINVAGE